MAAELCALAALSIGLVVSTGWLTYWLVLTTFGAASIPMAPSAAMAFLVLGAAAFALARWPVSRLGHCFALAASLLVSLAASLAVAEFVAGVDLGLEQLVAQPSETFMGYQGALMSPVTAACFVLAGLAVLSLSVRLAERWAAQDLAAGLAMIAMAVGSIVTIGYLFGAPLLYGGAIRPVALPAGLAFVALNASILLLAGPHARMLSPLRGSAVHARLLRALLPAVAATVLVTDWLEVSLVEPRHANPALWSALATIASTPVTAGRAAARREQVPMEALAQEAVQINAGAIAARRVQVEIAPGMPTVMGDRQRLLQVWQNLVGNAVKFMHDQPEPRVVLGLRHDGAEAVHFVRDNGAGIDPRFTKDVFDVFHKLDPRVEGSGIGLAIVKRIVELHGGRIWVESEGLGKGATFCFTVPETTHAR